MNALQEKLYLELRQTKYELEHSLKNKAKDDWMAAILAEELKDVDSALAKIENGNYGQCEISGELLPEELLYMIPTLKSLKDSETVDIFYKKPIQTPFS
ncbi:hypothetical protein [Neobacillus mesonae]|uniref:Uncharacterized protein n=1 Tax=Neobacillus mesonae TaxID=1193713 RepID=A0A3T0HWE1_9BACI|nr:hypothetical protein [Neobacillus mesonae]AZU61451.1 hypothetical protein CHR53_09335 [Neobacillus mesonae]